MYEASQQLLENHILASLPPEDYERLAPHLKPVQLNHGQILYEAGGRIEHVYFPLNSMISIISETSTGESVEVGICGYEGMAGISVLLGVDKSAHKNLVQVPDSAIQVSAEVILEEFQRGGALQSLVLRYMQSLLLQISQVAACNRLHSISERLARWLLMSDDRCKCSDLPFTQEFLSLMLGARRAGVTEAALVLQAEELIHYRRGHIKIKDREGMEQYTCECYVTLKAEFDRVTGLESTLLIR